MLHFAMKRTTLACGLLLVMVGSVAAQSKPEGKAPAAKGEWPQFLGPQRNGISTETGLVDSWPAAGPKPVWRAAGGVGMSGLAISRGRLLTMVQKDGKQWLAAFNA